MIRVAYLENGPSRDELSGLSEHMSSMGAQLDAFWAFGDHFPADPSEYNGFILSGSPLSSYDRHEFIAKEHTFIRAVADAGKPMLGLCFGSQILASALCGRDQVFRRNRCEVGYAPLMLSDAASSDSMTNLCAPTVEMFVWHNDEVRHNHPDMVVLASSHDCPNHIWRFRDLPVWGIQGHPEVTAKNGARWFGKCRVALEKDGADVDALIADARDSAGGLEMLSAFVHRCQPI